MMDVNKTAASPQLHQEGEASRSSHIPAGTLRQTLQAFYAAHNPEKVKDLETILSKFEGKHDRLVRELEKKYNVRLADYAPTARTIEELATNSTADLRLESEAMVASLRAEVARSKALHDAIRAEKATVEHTCLLLRREKADGEAQFREQKKWNEKIRERLKDAEGRETLAVQRSQLLEKQVSVLQEQLTAAGSEKVSVEVQLRERLEVSEGRAQLLDQQIGVLHGQLFESLRAKHELQVQFNSVLATLGQGSNPYHDEEPATGPVAATAPDSQGAGDSSSLGAARAEIALLLRSKSNMERQLCDKGHLVKGLAQAVAKLRCELAQRSESTDSLNSIVGSLRSQLAASEASLSDRSAQLEAAKEVGVTHLFTWIYCFHSSSLPSVFRGVSLILFDVQHDRP